MMGLSDPEAHQRPPYSGQRRRGQLAFEGDARRAGGDRPRAAGVVAVVMGRDQLYAQPTAWETLCFNNLFLGEGGKFATSQGGEGLAHT
jgi:hypothetical protein